MFLNLMHFSGVSQQKAKKIKAQPQPEFQSEWEWSPVAKRVAGLGLGLGLGVIKSDLAVVVVGFVISVVAPIARLPSIGKY